VGLIAAIFMLGAGSALAVFVVTAMKIHQAEESQFDTRPPQRDSVAASLLFHVARAGGATADEALRQVRRTAGLAAPVTQGIDAGNWAESYARNATPQQRETLLELAVKLVAAREGPVPLRQYAALLDLSFGLGFQTDALARLRKVYGFEYVDHTKGRPREEVPVRAELLSVFGLAATPTRQELSTAYRKLVAKHHPDRFHGATAEAQNGAAAKFIEITRAYEELLPICRD
jgi:transposase